MNSERLVGPQRANRGTYCEHPSCYRILMSMTLFITSECGVCLLSDPQESSLQCRCLGTALACYSRMEGPRNLYLYLDDFYLVVLLFFCGLHVFRDFVARDVRGMPQWHSKTQ